MIQSKFDKIFYIFFFVSLLSISIILISLWSINYSLFFGFAIGALVSYFNYELSNFSVLLILYKRKKSAIVFGILKHLFSLIIVGLVIYLIIYINLEHAKKINQKTIFFNKPINIFTFIFGITLLPFSLLWSNGIYNYLKKKGKDGFI
ncbi:hypothetical protein [Mycoplasmopsis alligatoris]|uniref:Conserved domain protein n=1 Tax=Mycoplasmopsis alligatoris A21JP2 TaxID=747682 RepID=D4XX21_9BACT|nr:hypothetical protein [Mycoplasmopsis alligatoris]EFF41105.1 conserved domain protein [Mycoplasmopsis alligatoris A21JP2]